MSDTCIAGLEEALEQLVQKQTGLPWEITSVTHTADGQGLIVSWAYNTPIGPEVNSIENDGKDFRSILHVSAQSDTNQGLTKLYGIHLDNHGMEALFILKQFHE
jgi:hypothetical protein